MGNPSHVIVLMFENRSFDHLLGFLPGVGDLTGDEFNRVDPANPESARVGVTNAAGPITTVDPGHAFLDTNLQLFGGGPPTNPAPMSGFVADYLKDAGGNLEVAKTIMECHAPESVPVLSALARSYCVCTRWFSSVPGPTWPNRFYVHAATSAGLVIDDHPDPTLTTIQGRLAAKDRTWRVYAGDIPQCLAIEGLFKQFVEDLLDPFGYHHFHALGRLFDDLKRGSLPSYAFIEPSYFETSAGHATDEHPPHDIRYGEALLSTVASSLAASDHWDESVLVVLYDEHGGFYDKVSPPVGVPNPDGRDSVNPSFDFTRLGVRVPAVLVSPFVEPATVDSTVYEHASIPATLNRIFDLGANSFLTRRDAAANTFERNFRRASARPGQELVAASAMVEGPKLEDISALDLSPRRAIELVLKELAAPKNPLSSHQQTLIDLVRSALPRLP
ncbi:MAG: alkaline phosphatase family protein [Chloroflexota bacterium]